MGQKIIKNSKQVYFFQLNKIKNVPKYLVIEDLKKKKSLKISSRSRELSLVSWDKCLVTSLIII